MTTRSPSMLNSSTTHRARTVAVISRCPHHHVVETVLGAVEHDVVFVGTVAHAYALVKKVMPDLIILCLSRDDWDAGQVLSMLSLDRATSRIPVRTYLTTQPDVFTDDAAAEAVFDEALPQLIELIAHR